MQLSDLTIPLGRATRTRGSFLQALISEFRVRSAFDRGIELHMRLDDETPCLLRSHSKTAVAERLDSSEGAAAAESVRRLRAASSPDEVDVRLDRFVFRHASAGVLVREADSSRVLLFSRDIAPAGWNIANGASSRADEFLDVEALMRREVGEEFLHVDHVARRIHPIFATEPGSEARTGVERVARKLELEPSPSPHPRTLLRWIPGPDALVVTYGSRTHRTPGLFISVNAADFGIECSRILVVAAPDGVTPVDGELLDGEPLDRPIGAFTREALQEPFPEPEQVFRSGAEWPRDRVPPQPLCPVTADLLERAGL